MFARQINRTLRSSAKLSLRNFRCTQSVFSIPSDEMKLAKSMPKSFRGMSVDNLMVFVANENFDAIKERMIREIMCVRDISWEEARKVQLEMQTFNRKGLSLYTLPYHIGIGTAVIAGFASIPLIFDLNTVSWFNEMFVTADVPEAKDLETPLEVGSWAWNWMEPPLGQISFFLLCMQYSRSQLQNLDYKPYTHWVLDKRAQRLVARYPEFSKEVVHDFSINDPLSGDDDQ